MSISFGRWIIDARAQATSDAFVSIEFGSPELCGCDPCTNFAAVRRKAYPKGFRPFLRQLGVPYDRESEICHYGRLESGLHFYGGWFHFVGQIVEGADAFVPRDSTGGTYDLYRVTDKFRFGITAHTDLVPSSFPMDGVLQLEFATDVPWVIDATPVD